MVFLMIIVEVAIFLALAFHLAAWAQGSPRVRDWSLTSPYPRRDRRMDRS